MDNDATSITITIRYTGNNISESRYTVENKAYAVYTQDNTIYALDVEAGMPYQLFNISGKMIVSGIANSGILSINIYQKGIYILRIGTQVKKVLVK